MELNYVAIATILGLARRVQIQLPQEFLSQPERCTRELRRVQDLTSIRELPKLIVGLCTESPQVVEQITDSLGSGVG